MKPTLTISFYEFKNLISMLQEITESTSRIHGNKLGKRDPNEMSRVDKASETTLSAGGTDVIRSSFIEERADLLKCNGMHADFCSQAISQQSTAKKSPSQLETNKIFLLTKYLICFRFPQNNC